MNRPVSSRLSPQHLCGIICAFAIGWGGWPSAIHATAISSPRPATSRHLEGPMAFKMHVLAKPEADGTVLHVTVHAAEVLAHPHPYFGHNKPVSNGHVALYLLEDLSEPRRGKKRQRNRGKRYGRHAVPLADAGSYGATFTVPNKGQYSLHMVGRFGTLGDAHISMGVATGEEQTASASHLRLPKKLPPLERGDLTRGASLCKAHCRKDLPYTLPPSQTPTFITSTFGAARDNDQLLRDLLTPAVAQSLDPVARYDLLRYVRSLHLDIASFFPDATVTLTHTFTIDEVARERLEKEAKIQLDDEAAKGTVFVAFKAAGHGRKGQPQRIPYEDFDQRANLKTEDKLGYVVFFSGLKGKLGYELAVALGREPHYPILAAQARKDDGETPKRLNKRLSVFVGQGRVGDAKSLRGGRTGIRRALLPLYLQAAELANTYTVAEREFTAFDRELGMK